MIDVTADEADEAHLHGYDIEKNAGPGNTARFGLDADLEGIDEMEGATTAPSSRGSR